VEDKAVFFGNSRTLVSPKQAMKHRKSKTVNSGLYAIFFCSDGGSKFRVPLLARLFAHFRVTLI
jgi:hypothetical protein